MIFLQSSWAAAIVGLACYWLTTMVCWTKSSATLAPPRVHHEPAAPDSTSGPSWNFKNAEVNLLMEDLRKQKEALALREQQLNEYAARLGTERVELNQVTQRVGLMQAEFDRMVVEVKKEEVGNLKRLAKNYAAMSPDGAVAILKELKDPELVKILVLMKEAEAGPILEALGKGGDAEAKRASLISEKLRLVLARNAKAKPKSL
jgi:flagellar motility protein MotE (MotC chaperone)